MAPPDDLEDTDGPEHFETSGLEPARPIRDDDIEHDERFIDAFDDQRLFFQSWAPAGGSPEHGVVALMHGYGEHSSRYDHAAGALVRAGFGVMAIDARGAGRSTGKRAFVADFDDYIRDFERLLDRADRRWPDLPVFALGHSNGGLIVLRHAQLHPFGESPLSGIVVTSPFLGFQIEVPAHKAAAARAMSRVWPSFSLPSEVDPADLTHDTEVVEAYEDDPLVLDVATARWFTEVQKAQETLREDAAAIEHPALFLVAGSDELADPSVADSIFHDLGAADREMEIFPNLYHEILNEPNWPRIVDRIVEWMHRIRASEPGEAA